MTAFTTIALVAGAAGTLASISQQQKAAKLQKQQQALAARRSRRQAIRQAQVARAQATATAQGGGALESSGATGGIGALGSQLGEALGFSTQMSGLSRAIGGAQSRAALFGSVGELGLTAFQSLGGFDNMKPTKARVPDYTGIE